MARPPATVTTSLKVAADRNEPTGSGAGFPTLDTEVPTKMRVISTNRGFSLVELLTVIAIIAILAAIIFPVMSTVRGRANESNCLTNLQQIGQAVQMFKQDNRRYPDILGSEAVTMTDPPQKWTGSGSPDMFENAKDKYLFPEYTKSSIKVFHCPSSRITNSRDVVRAYKLPGDAASEVVIYAYDSYNSYVTGGVPPGGDPPFSLYTEGSTAEMHYRTNWAPTLGDVTGGGMLQPFPPREVDDGPKVQQQDYERQLRWRNPPGDTLITWCSYHETRQGNDPSRWSGKAQALFLDGSVAPYPANEMEVCRWRVRPKK